MLQILLMKFFHKRYEIGNNGNIGSVYQPEMNLIRSMSVLYHEKMKNVTSSGNWTSTI